MGNRTIVALVVVQLLNVYLRDCGQVERAKYVDSLLSYYTISEPHRSHLPGHLPRQAKTSRYRECIAYGLQSTRNTIPLGDLAAVLQRARDAGVRSQIITGGSLSESKEALQLAKEHGIFLHSSLSQ